MTTVFLALTYIEAVYEHYSEYSIVWMYDVNDHVNCVTLYNSFD